MLLVSSGVARKIFPFWGGYAMSKAALEMIGLTYAANANGTNVKVNLLDPGALRSIMRAKAMPGEDPSTLKRPRRHCALIVELLSPSCQKQGELVNFQ